MPAYPTPAHLAAIARAIRDVATSEQSCHDDGIEPDLFAAWMRRGARDESGPCHLFHHAVRKVEADCALRCLQVINGEAEGKRSIAAWMLERRHGFTRDGVEDIDLELQSLAELPPSMLRAALEIAESRRVVLWMAAVAVAHPPSWLAIGAPMTVDASPSISPASCASACRLQPRHRLPAGQQDAATDHQHPAPGGGLLSSPPFPCRQRRQASRVSPADGAATRRIPDPVRAESTADRNVHAAQQLLSACSQMSRDAAGCPAAHEGCATSRRARPLQSLSSHFRSLRAAPL